VKIEKLDSVDAFVVFDLEAAPTSTGIVRLAPKVLVDGATWLARSQTYQHASFGLEVGGASAGINARPDGRAQALAEFVSEVKPWIESHRLALDAGRGVTDADLGALRSHDVRGSSIGEERALGAIGIAESMAAAIGALDGRTVAIEGFDDRSLALIDELVSRGARVVAVQSAVGTAVEPAGFERDRLADAVATGADAVTPLVDQVDLPAAVFAAPADVLVVGSKAGVLDHTVASTVTATMVVPSGPIPVTAKALALLTRQGTTVLPDFLTTAGPIFVGFPGARGSEPDARAAVVRHIPDAVREVLGTDESPVLVACRRAEAFLATWCDDLPFGRPLA
jgi:glutamate dehydrogenase/leucine dehydrogenase